MITGQNATNAANAISQAYNAGAAAQTTLAACVAALTAAGATTSAANVQAVLNGMQDAMAAVKAEAQMASELGSLN